MCDISLDLNPVSATYKDLLLFDNDLILTLDANPNGTNNVQQDVLQRVRFFLGEWFLDNTQGLPWYQQILVKNPNQGNIDTIIQNAILGTPGVQGLLYYSVTQPNARVVNIAFSVQTTSGTVSYNGTLANIGGNA